MLTLVKAGGTQTPETNFGESLIQGMQAMYRKENFVLPNILMKFPRFGPTNNGKYRQDNDVGKQVFLIPVDADGQV